MNVIGKMLFAAFFATFFVCGCMTLPLRDEVVTEKISYEAWTEHRAEQHGNSIGIATIQHPERHYVTVSGKDEQGDARKFTYHVTPAQYARAVVGKPWSLNP